MMSEHHAARAVVSATAGSPVLRTLMGLVVALSASFVVGCGSTGPYIWVQNYKNPEEVPTIKRGDTISVAVRNQRPLSGSFTVLENGAYAQPVVGQVTVAGLTEAQASKKLANLLKGIVVEPQVVVTVVTPRPVRVSVLGEVRTPGQFAIQYDETVLSVLARSGGLTTFADGNGIYVIRQRPELRRIRFRYQHLKAADPASTTFRLRDGDVIVVE